MIRLEKRLEPSRMMTAVTPVIAVVLTMIVGGIMFALLGKPPFEAIRIIFWDPLAVIFHYFSIFSTTCKIRPFVRVLYHVIKFLTPISV